MGKKMQILDVVRICAALMVFTVHFFMFVEAPSAISDITANFSSGVALFFVISGYLMMQSLERCESLSAYFKKRVIRIMPSYYAVVLAGIAVWDLWLGKMPADELGLGWLRYFLFLNTIVPSKNYYSWNDLWGLWTFSCFMVFYLLAPLFKRMIRTYRQSLVFLLLTIIGGYAAGYLMEHLLVGMGYQDAYIIASDSPWFNLNIFAFGMSLWYALREKKERGYAGVCAVILTALLLIDKINRISFGCVTVIFIIAFLNVEWKNKTAVQAIEVLSRYSFPLYLVHLGVMELLNLVRENGYISSNILFAALCILLSAAAAVLLYQLVERPVTKMLAGKRKSNGYGKNT